MKKLLLLLVFMFSMLFTTVSQDTTDTTSIDTRGKPTEVNLNISVKPKPMGVTFSNVLETLDKNDINRIISSFEKSDSIKNDLMSKSATMLDKDHLYSNKVLYQAETHFDISKSKVISIINRNKKIDLYIYGLIFLMLIVQVNLYTRSKLYKEQDELIRFLKFLYNIGIYTLVLWFLVRPALWTFFNHDYRFIEFLLQTQ